MEIISKLSAGEAQGPGDVSRAMMVRVNSRDEVIIVDGANKKFVTFDRNGNFINETPIHPSLFEVNPLENERYLIKKRQVEEEKRSEYIAQDSLILCDAKFDEIREIEREKVPNISTITRFRPMFSVFYSVANGRIYVGNNEKGYEIHIFDLEGNLLKKIKKEYQPVVVPEEFKKKIREILENVGRKISFPDRFPPFQYMFTDDQGRLFVMTYEKGERPKGYIYDIFNPNGVSIGRISLDNYGYLGYIRDQGPLDAKAENNRLYCIREKENGYKVLVVYQMRWE